MDPRLYLSLSVLGMAALLRVLLYRFKKKLSVEMDATMRDLQTVRDEAERMGKYFQRFTYTHERSTTFEEMSRLMERVNERILVTSGWISHDPLIAALLENGEKDIRVVMKPPEKVSIENIDANTTNEGAMNELRERISCRLCEEVHAKMMIADGALVLGSTNFTNRGFSKNVEANIVTEDPKLVESAEDFFQRVWEMADAPKR